MGVAHLFSKRLLYAYRTPGRLLSSKVEVNAEWQVP